MIYRQQVHISKSSTHINHFAVNPLELIILSQCRALTLIMSGIKAQQCKKIMQRFSAGRKLFPDHHGNLRVSSDKSHRLGNIRIETAFFFGGLFH